MRNLFGEFKVFCEKDNDRPDSYVSQIKKQTKVPKKIWLGMPVVISNTKLGDSMIREPTAFYVIEFDTHTVILKPVPYAYGDEDQDDEIDLEKDDGKGKTFTITINNFYKLVAPQNFQGADFNTAGSGIQFKSAGNTLTGPSSGGMGMGGM